MRLRENADTLRWLAIAALAVAAVVLAVWRADWSLPAKSGTSVFPLWAVVGFVAAAWTVGHTASQLWPGADAALGRAHVRGSLGDNMAVGALLIGFLLGFVLRR